LNGKFYGRRQVGKQNQEELLLAAEFETLEEVGRGQDHLEVTY
jgi:hypothetical protein